MGKEKKDVSYVGNAVGSVGNIAAWLCEFGIGIFLMSLLFGLVGWWIIPITAVVGVGCRYLGKYLIYRNSVKDVPEDQRPGFSHFDGMINANLNAAAA
jgi:hypothetical protein